MLADHLKDFLKAGYQSEYSVHRREHEDKQHKLSEVMS